MIKASILILFFSLLVSGKVDKNHPREIGLPFNSCIFFEPEIKNDSTMKVCKSCTGSQHGEHFDSTLTYKYRNGKLRLTKTVADTGVIIKIEIDSVKRSNDD